jgi:O-antigen ligase
VIGLSLSALLYRPDRHRALRVIVSGGIVVGIFALVFAPFVLSRLSGTAATEQVSIDERLAQTALAWRLFGQQPLTGVAAGNFPLYNSSAMVGLPAQRAHNVPLLIASELGLPGLGLWLISVWAVIVAGIRSSRAATALWPMALTSALIALLVIAQFDYYWWTSSQGVYGWATICGALLAAVSEKSDR